MALNHSIQRTGASCSGRLTRAAYKTTRAPKSKFLSFMAFADGVFVFRWNKAADIKEPAQKAIIVYDHGREDLLLQVKYEGRLQNFGWLIPVPSLPEVQRGWMAPFYELSRLTQNPFAGMTAGTPRIGGVRSEQVNVVEIKTVGVYEVAILSAHDALSLERWLGSNGYSGPEGRSQVPLSDTAPRPSRE